MLKIQHSTYTTTYQISCLLPYITRSEGLRIPTPATTTTTTATATATMKIDAHLFRFLLFTPRNSDITHIPTLCLSTTTTTTTLMPYSHFFSTHSPSSLVSETSDTPPFTSAAQVFLKWGCTPSDLSLIFSRQPSLRNSYPAPLQSKLSLLSRLGIRSPDLVKIINCRPRFLSCNLTRYFDERLDDLSSFLGSKDKVAKAIVRNPSLILYDFKTTVEPVVSLYQQLGVSKSDFVSMLLLRPTLIPRTHMTPEKLDYIRRTGVPQDSKMYKYVVTIMGVSRIETIREKIANFDKFGFSEDEVLLLFGRAPLLMTLSVDKVQRNMTFVVGTMKMPHHSVVDHPYLLFASLEDVLKPRVLLAGKIQDMDLHPQIKGTRLMTALRMNEKRFLAAFVNCHEKDVRDELLEYYQTAKGFKRLAESSRKKVTANGFPF